MLLSHQGPGPFDMTTVEMAVLVYGLLMQNPVELSEHRPLIERELNEPRRPDAVEQGAELIRSSTPAIRDVCHSTQSPQPAFFGGLSVCNQCFEIPDSGCHRFPFRSDIGIKLCAKLSSDNAIPQQG